MNEDRFTDKGSVYAKARPAYPKELFALLCERGIVTSDCRVADIGSGTGIFTSQIAPYVKTVHAIEPNADMREQAEILFQSFDNIISVDGTAEHTSLNDDAVDCITVAQAFHWFDRQAFRTECKRILTENGYVVLVWNDRDPSKTIIQENYRINSMFCPQFKGSSAGISFEPESFDDFFRKRCECVTFSNSYQYDLSMYLERNLSSSYAPRKGDKSYEPYIQTLTSLFEDLSNNGYIEYPYITRCYIGKV